MHVLTPSDHRGVRTAGAWAGPGQQCRLHGPPGASGAPAGVRTNVRRWRPQTEFQLRGRRWSPWASPSCLTLPASSAPPRGLCPHLLCLPGPLLACTFLVPIQCHPLKPALNPRTVQPHPHSLYLLPWTHTGSVTSAPGTAPQLQCMGWSCRHEVLLQTPSSSILQEASHAILSCLAPSTKGEARQSRAAGAQLCAPQFLRLPPVCPSQSAPQAQAQRSSLRSHGFRHICADMTPRTPALPPRTEDSLPHPGSPAGPALTRVQADSRDATAPRMSCLVWHMGPGTRAPGLPTLAVERGWLRCWSRALCGQTACQWPQDVLTAEALNTPGAPEPQTLVHPLQVRETQ
ncbi:uncharacterized protein LOC115831504 [Nomascus leucogenys]|uniref:uncharacterized protein LOC115831504 n=1 Tax=Nomascus leucogenys TaxID=61853 RepID=UPI00122D5B67|nr:uncharacterized protein LOC115831504 [Nomascus leucogenys]